MPFILIQGLYVNRFVKNSGAFSFHYAATLFYQASIPVFLLSNFSENQASSWFIAVSLFTIITALDLGILQYLNFRLYRLNSKGKFSYNTQNIIKIYNGYIYGSIILITIISFCVALNFYAELLFLSLGISLGYLNRYFQIVLKSYNKLPIGVLINSFPVLIFIGILYFQKNGNIFIIGFYYFLCQNIAIILFILFLTRKTDFTFKFMLRRDKNILFLKRATKYWSLQLLQMATQFLPVILIGNIFSASELMLFVTLRTIATLPLSVSLVMTAAIGPYITDLVTKNISLIKKKILQLKTLFLLCSAICYFFIYILGGYIYSLWLDDKIEYNAVLFLILCVRSFLQIIISLEQNISVYLGNPLSKIAYEMYMIVGFGFGIIATGVQNISLAYFVLLFLILPQVLAFIHLKVLKK